MNHDQHIRLHNRIALLGYRSAGFRASEAWHTGDRYTSQDLCSAYRGGEEPAHRYKVEKITSYVVLVRFNCGKNAIKKIRIGAFKPSRSLSTTTFK